MWNMSNKTRSNLLRKAIIATVFLACVVSTFAGLSSGKRPNFVFIITDDISPRDLGPYGNTFVKTPNLDRIAKQGLVFDNAYNVISSCSPSRCAIITGRYPHNTGAPELHTKLPKDQRTFVQELQKAGYHTVISGKNHMADSVQLGFDVSSGSKPSGSENWVRHLQERPKEKPFFCWFASHDAHYDFQINDKAPVYKPEEVDVPPMMFDGELTRQELTGFYHEVSRTDYYTGQIMKELKAQGIADNTYVIYCSDNGRPFPRCKSYMYDSGTRTPLIVTGPGIKSGRSDSLVSSIDYSATILELASVKKPETVQGVSFTSILKNPKVTTRDVAFAERNWHVFALHERMVRTGDWLYIWNAWPDRHNVCLESSGFRFPAAKELWQAAEAGKLTDAQKLLTITPQPTELLFNVKDDPYQFANQVDNPKQADILEKMRSLLKVWKKQTGDSVQKKRTGDRQPLHNEDKNGKHAIKRGDFPGTDNDAANINHPGPIRIKDVSQRDEKIKVVVLTGGHGFKQEPFFASLDGYDDIEYVHAPQAGDSEIFEYISDWDYDVILLYSMKQEISPKRQRNFIQLLENGVGLMILHHAVAEFPDWPEYRKILGAKYYLQETEENGKVYQRSKAKHGVTMKINLTDQQHPITGGMSGFRILDETYKGHTFEEDNQILLTTNNPGNEKPICWVR